MSDRTVRSSPYFGNPSSNSSMSSRGEQARPPNATPYATLRQREPSESPDQLMMDTDKSSDEFNAQTAQHGDPRLVSQGVLANPNQQKIEENSADSLADPVAENFALAIADRARKSTEFRVELRVGMEEALVKGLLDCTAWEHVHIRTHGNVDSNFLLNLESKLRAAGLKKTVSLEMSLVSPWHKMPSFRAGFLDFRLLGLAPGQEKEPSPSLLRLLKNPNPNLKCFVWKGPSEISSLVQALTAGSHELFVLGLTAPGIDASAFIAMLKLKTRLDGLVLRQTVFNARLPLAEVVLAAKSLRALDLMHCQITLDGLLGTASALSKSKLQKLELLDIPDWGSVNVCDSRFQELIDGISSATALATLCLSQYGTSSVNRHLLKAFAQNKAAQCLQFKFSSDTEQLLVDLGTLNEERKKEGWVPLRLDIVNGRVAADPVPQESPRGNLNGTEQADSENSQDD